MSLHDYVNTNTNRLLGDASTMTVGNCKWSHVTVVPMYNPEDVVIDQGADPLSDTLTTYTTCTWLCTICMYVCSVMIHFILYSTTLLDFTDIFFLHTYLYYLLIHAYSSTYSCTVRVAMHSPRSHAQFTQPCTVRAASHSSCTVHTQPCTVPAQSTRSHAQFMSLGI